MVGLDGLDGLLQPKPFYDSMLLRLHPWAEESAHAPIHHHPIPPDMPSTRQAKRALAPYSHWMYHALQIALLRRIFSRQSSRSPLKFFHLGDTSFPLKYQEKERLRGTIPEPSQSRVSRGGCASGDARGHQPGGKSGAGAAVWLCCGLLAWHPREHPWELPALLFTPRTAQT